MCGRYQQGSNQPALKERFETSNEPPESGTGRANVAPTQDVIAVVATGDDGEREARLLRWGLLPTWAKVKGGPTLINARDDKLTGTWKRYTTPAHRCLVPATAWIEWLRSEDRKTKQPFLHQLDGEETFSFAGLWTAETPKGADERMPSVTIITCAAADPEITKVHARQPVVLADRAAEQAWLSSDVDQADVRELVRPLPAGSTIVTPGSDALNNVRNERRDLLADERV